MEALRLLGAMFGAQLIHTIANLAGLLLAVALAENHASRAMLGASVADLTGAMCASLLIVWAALPGRPERHPGPHRRAWIALPVTWLVLPFIAGFGDAACTFRLVTMLDTQDLEAFTTLRQALSAVGALLETVAWCVAFSLVFARASARTAPRT